MKQREITYWAIHQTGQFRKEGVVGIAFITFFWKLQNSSQFLLVDMQLLKLQKSWSIIIYKKFLHSNIVDSSNELMQLMAYSTFR